jgi:hypothetical protein
MSEGCEDPWSFFVAKTDREQKCLGNTDVDSFLTGRSYELGNMIRENLVCRFRFFVCMERRTNSWTDRCMLTESTVNAVRMLKRVTVISKKDMGPTSLELH